MNDATEVWQRNFNLATNLTKDVLLRNRLAALTTRLADLGGTNSVGTAYIEERNKIITSIWKDCGHNFSMLTPYYFPQFPKGKPMSMIDRPFNMCLMFSLPFWNITMRGSRQIGKTTTLGTRTRIVMEMFRRYRSMYVAPHTEPLKTFARKYDEISQGFRNPVKDSHKFTQNLYYKKYPTGGSLELVRIQTSATPARGKTEDEILLDECQLFDPDLETEILEVINDSDIQSVLYAGTSTNFDSLLELRYQEGSQATWQILKDDGSVIDCGDPDAIIPYIGEYTMVDPETGNRIDPLRGYYKFNNPGALLDRNFSVHIPQIINPDICSVPIKWNALYRTLMRDPSKFVQEKLGIPLESASREITKADLQRMCRPDIVGTPEERLRRCRNGYYKLIVSGVDWGGSDYNQMTKTKISSTVHFILGLTKDNNLHIINIKRHGGMDYKTIINLIAADHLKYNAMSIATDFGVGETYHELMRSHPVFNTGRHIIFHYTGPRSAICGVMKGQLSNTLNLNRTETLSSLFLAISMPEPMILAPSWEEMEEYLSDFLNIHRILQEKEGEGGQRQFLYHRVASKADDTVHAANFAFSLVRLVYNQILLEDNNARSLLRAAVLGSDAAAAQGNFVMPSNVNKLIQQANETWKDSPEDWYYTDDYLDYE